MTWDNYSEKIKIKEERKKSKEREKQKEKLRILSEQRKVSFNKPQGNSSLQSIK